jgi:hypothetical protein
VKRLLLGTISLFAFAGSAQAAVVTNGDFEAAGGSLNGWTETPGPEIFAINGAAYGPCCGANGTPAQLANTFASFGPGVPPEIGTNVSVLFQDVATIIGNRYRLSFEHGAFGIGSQTLFANVNDVLSNALLGSGNYVDVAQAGPDALGLVFSSSSFEFTATGLSTRLAFNVDPFSANVDGVLDNVSLAAVVPEPSTWALLILGFGAIGFAMRRCEKVCLTYA